MEVGSQKRQCKSNSQAEAYLHQEVLLIAVGEVGCHLLGTWFFPLHSGEGIITRLHQGKVKVCLLTALCW